MSQTILFQPPNRLGLGHINRLAAVAFCVRELDASVRVIFAIEGGNDEFVDALALPCIPLPSTHTLHESGAWNLWPSHERQKIEFVAARAAVASVEPDIIVFDTLPNRALFRAAMERNIPIGLCLRAAKDIDSYVRQSF